MVTNKSFHTSKAYNFRILACHSERSEESQTPGVETLHFVQGDTDPYR